MGAGSGKQKFRNAQILAMSALAETTGNHFCLGRPTTLSQLTNRRYITSLLAKDKEKLSYPFAYMSLSNVSRDAVTGQRKETLMPSYGKKNITDGFIRHIGLVRVVFTFNYVYITDGQEDLLDFVGMWHFAREGRGPRLNFKLDYYGLGLTHRVLTSTDLSFNEIDYDEGTPVEHEVTGTIEVHGFLTNVKAGNELDFGKTPLIQKAPKSRPQLIYIDRTGKEVVQESNVNPIIYRLREDEDVNRGT